MVYNVGGARAFCTIAQRHHVRRDALKDVFCGGSGKTPLSNARGWAPVLGIGRAGIAAEAVPERYSSRALGCHGGVARLRCTGHRPQ